MQLKSYILYIIAKFKANDFTSVFAPLQVFTAICRKTLTHFSLQDYNLKKNSSRDVFLWVFLLFQNIFSQNTFWWWLLLLNTIHFLCCIDLISKLLLPSLAMFWLSLILIRMEEGDKKPPTRFSPVFLNVGSSPKNSLIFSFNPFATLV